MNTDLKHQEKTKQRAASYLDAQVDELEITKLARDASTRSYYRVRSSRKEKRETPTTTLVVCSYGNPFDPDESAVSRLHRAEAVNPGARLTFANDPRAHIETTRYFSEARLPVPRIIDIIGEDGTLLLEDVGDLRMQEWLTSASLEDRITAFHKTIEMVVVLQEQTSRVISDHSICSELVFDESKLYWELDFFFINFFERFLSCPLDKVVDHTTREEARRLCHELSTRPRALTHRDYHTRNLMMRGDDIYIIDFQDARLGPAAYDVASLLRDPYCKIEHELSAKLLTYFIDLKSKSSFPLADPAGFEDEYEMMIAQRMLKAVGTYSNQAAVRGNQEYLPYIKPALESAIASLSRLGRFSWLLKSAEYGLEEAVRKGL